MPVFASPSTKITKKHVVLLLCNGAYSINQIKKLKNTHTHTHTQEPVRNTLRAGRYDFRISA